jgi:hypothetical protein
MRLKRIYHHYSKWEDYTNGMYKKLSVDEEQEYLDKAIWIMKNEKMFGSFMRKVTNEWKFACEHNLSDNSCNRRAWMGQSALCYAFQCPEYITRLAWWQLTKEEKDRANAEADETIKQWEIKFIFNPAIDLFK